MQGSRPGRLLQALRRAKPDNFVLLLGLMVLLGRFLPGPGIAEGPFSLASIASAGVSLIFFFYGLRISWEQMAQGLRKWKLHLLIQSVTFLLFPLIVLPGLYFFADGGHRYLWLGIFFLAALPSTVSSSIVMVSIAGGEIPAAIFNATLSGLLGIAFTPLWMSAVGAGAQGSVNGHSVFGQLALQVLLPLTAGMLLQSRLGALAQKHRNALRKFDQAIILTIVYSSFAESFSRKLFSGIGVSDLLLLGGGMLALFAVVYQLTRQACRLLRLGKKETITAVFCGSKKSLVHGTVLSKVLFPASAATGILLLPLMIYHALQLIVAGFLAQRMSRATNEPEGQPASIYRR